ncbi:hypothetical protein Tco_1539807 [Tanacetum coccineum]
MSMIGKMSFFLRTQISQSPRGIFIPISQKYALGSLKKYGFDSCDPVDTPIVKKSKLDEDKKGKAVDLSHYRGIIGTHPCTGLRAKRALHAGQKDLLISKSNRLSGTMVFESILPIAPFTKQQFADADHAGCQR